MRRFGCEDLFQGIEGRNTVLLLSLSKVFFGYLYICSLHIPVNNPFEVLLYMADKEWETFFQVKEEIFFLSLKPERKLCKKRHKLLFVIPSFFDLINSRFPSHVHYIYN